jgi:cytoplasmic iron level regulating protein YaaA (DUF328/UPF0246 family)
MSNILILAICSNHKIESGNDVEYAAFQGIEKFLTENLATEMYDARRQIRKLISSDMASRDGKPLNELPYNQDIVHGMDFRGPVKQGDYLPALQRYDGRFYKEFGKQEERLSYLATDQFEHDMLIVSGLYGLLTPTELIQCYSCHVTDHSAIAKKWTENDLLTRLIVEYIKKRNIVKVFDFMGEESYRNLISWQTIRYETSSNVLHCYSKQFAGAALLPSLGILARKFLVEKSESELLNIRSEQVEKVPNDEIVFLRFPVPGKELAREIIEHAIIASNLDKIGRMRRNILRFLIVAVGDTARSHYNDFGVLVQRLKDTKRMHDENAAEKMKKFARLRNEAEYENRELSQKQWQEIREYYNYIEDWAKSRNRYGKAEGLEKIEG